MTAALLDDLSLADLASGLAADCDVRECVPLTAVAIAFWDKPCCDEAERASLLCKPHLERVQALMSKGRTWTCDPCGSVRRIKRIEPLR